jgi:hypothetical protein
MTSRLSSITCTTPGQYRVQLEVLGTDQRLTFDFSVNTAQNIDVVTRDDDFIAYIAQNLRAYSPLMEAVLKFHLAQKVEYP